MSGICIWKLYQELYLKAVSGSCIWKLIIKLCLKALSGICIQLYPETQQEPVFKTCIKSCILKLQRLPIALNYFYNIFIHGGCFCSTYSDIYFLHIFSAINLFNKIFLIQSCNYHWRNPWRLLRSTSN
jgi:hypothetical protein